jgi:PhnB protein
MSKTEDSDVRSPGAPQGIRTLTNFIIVANPTAAMDWYMRVLGALDLGRLSTPDGSRVLHGELRIGDSVLMLAQEFPERGSRAPRPDEPASSVLMLYVPDVDGVYGRAIAAGAVAIEAPVDQFWGARQGRFRDPFGHCWSVATQLRDLTMEEMRGAVAQFVARSKTG